MKIIRRSLVALAAGVVGAFALATPASAQDDLPLPSGWVALPGTSVVELDGEHVLRMDQTGTTAGTSLENSIGGSIHADLEVSFSFKLESGNCGGGAPRVFIAGGALYGQVLTCDTAAGSEWQTVDLIVDGSWWSGATNHASFAEAAVVGVHGGTPLGSVGLVFDNGAGVAFFKDIVIGAALDLGEPEPTPSPDPSPSVSPTTAPPAGEGGGDDTAEPGLPVTGVSTGAFVGGAAALLAAGGGLYLVARKRRVSFTA